MSNERLSGLLCEIYDSAYKRCAQSEKYKDAEQRHKSIMQEIGDALPKGKTHLYNDLLDINAELSSIEHDYGDEAIFFYGMEMGVLFANYKEVGGHVYQA